MVCGRNDARVLQFGSVRRQASSLACTHSKRTKSAQGSSGNRGIFRASINEHQYEISVDDTQQQRLGSSSPSSGSLEASRPILDSCSRSQDRMSPRWPPIGRAQRRLFNGLFSAPAHQYSLITISDQPRRPSRVRVKISIVRPCFGPLALCRWRSNSTSSWVQHDRVRPRFVVLTKRSNTLKNDGSAKLFMAKLHSYAGSHADSMLRGIAAEIIVRRGSVAQVQRRYFTGKIAHASLGRASPAISIATNALQKEQVKAVLLGAKDWSLSWRRCRSRN